MAQLIAIGFWTDHEHRIWPDPQEFITLDLDQTESRQVACYLDQGTVVRGPPDTPMLPAVQGGLGADSPRQPLPVRLS